MKLRGAAVFLMGVIPLCFVPTASSYEGSDDYLAFCSSCHGSTAKGDGPLAAALRRRPADLTQLAKKNDGVFPAEKVFTTIDAGGRAHGLSAEMPEWASVFAKSRGSESPAEVRARIEQLVLYIRTLQAKR